MTTSASPSRSRTRERLLSWGMPAVLLSPSIWWVARDRSVWSWDPSFYAMDTTDLWFFLWRNPRHWLERMTTIFHAKAPGIAWLGQFFVPLGRWMGSIELGLLVSVLATQLAALVLVYRSGRRIAPASQAPAVMGTLLLAGGPMFAAMSHHYLTEALQLFSITYVLWVAAASTSLPPIRTLLHLALATVVGVTAKFSTPAYVLLPALFAAFNAIRALSRPGARITLGTCEVSLALATAVLGKLGFDWYRRNWAEVYAFAKLAASGDMALDYGSRGPLLGKLAYWVAATGKVVFTPVSALLLLAAAAGAAVLLSRGARARDTGRTAAGSGRLALSVLLQVLLTLLMMSNTINEETRYLLPLAPMMAVLLVWLLAELGSRPVVLAVTTILAAQWTVVHARQLGALEADAGSYWARPPAPDPSKRREVAAVVEETCNERSAGKWSMVGMNLDWLNHYTLMFGATQTQLERGFRCYYQYLGHAPRDPDAAFRRLGEIDGPYFVSLQESAMPQPPDFLNHVSRDVLRLVENDPRFMREPFASPSGIVVFRRLGRGEERP